MRNPVLPEDASHNGGVSTPVIASASPILDLGAFPEHFGE
jgi:hypothetical protein